MKRLLAVLGAVAMIGGALLVRNVFIEGDGLDVGGGGGGGGGEAHLVCATELEDACAALAEEDGDITFEVEDAGETAERLTAADFDPREAEFDAWLTLEPWAELIDVRRQQAQGGRVLDEPSDVLATSRLALIGPDERLAALEAACGGEVGWNCLGEIAGEPWADHEGEVQWGDVNVGHSDPSLHASGLVVLGQAASDYFGTTDFASNDFDAAFSRWLRQLESADPGVQGGLTPLEEALRFTGSWDGVGDLDAAGRGDLGVLYPSPMLRAEVVLAPLRGHDVDVDEDALTDALTEADFDEGPGDGVEGPSAGVYEALLGEWERATR